MVSRGDRHVKWLSVNPRLRNNCRSAEEDDAAKALGVASVLTAPPLTYELEKVAIWILGAKALADVCVERVDLLVHDVGDIHIEVRVLRSLRS